MTFARARGLTRARAATRMFTFGGVAALAAVAALAGPLGCTDETTAATSTGPTGRITLVVKSPANGVCTAVGDDAFAEVPIVVDVDNAVLRPPGTCGVYTQCGHLELQVNGIPNNAGATEVIPVLLRKLAEPLGDFDVSLRIVKDDGTYVLDSTSETGAVLEAHVALVTRASCPSGAGGGGGTGGASASSTSGGGGMGGAAASSGSVGGAGGT